MFESKALDLGDEELKEGFWTWERCNYGFFSFFYKPYREIRHFFCRAKKNYLLWKNVLRYDYDFDFHCHFTALRYKLQTVHDCIKDDYAVQEDKDMQALRICIKLAKRLEDDRYEDRAWRKIEAKYGELGHDTVPLNDGSGCSRWITTYGGVVASEEVQEAANQDRLPLYDLAEKCRVRDERNLYAIMLKHRRSWWS
jgi:hypothetical protein